MDTPIRITGFNPGSSNDSGSAKDPGHGTCAHCGQSLNQGNRGLEQLLGKLGISDEMVSNLKNSIQNVDFDEYLNTAREYLKSGSDKATSYTKENPGKVAAGVAALAVGAGLLITALSKDKEKDLDRI